MKRLVLFAVLLALPLFACGGAQPELPDGGPADDGSLDLNDVSFLYPLPLSPAGLDGLLPLDAAGRGGPLLPRAVYDQLPPLVGDLDAGTVWGELRVVSVRIPTIVISRSDHRDHEQGS